jgi:hypothetical protein
MRALQIVHQAPQRDPLAERAAALWPHSTELQRRWLRAVAMVRQTRRGWLLDKPQERQA